MNYPETGPTNIAIHHHEITTTNTNKRMMGQRLMCRHAGKSGRRFIGSSRPQHGPKITQHTNSGMKMLTYTERKICQSLDISFTIKQINRIKMVWRLPHPWEAEGGSPISLLLRTLFDVILDKSRTKHSSERWRKPEYLLDKLSLKFSLRVEFEEVNNQQDCYQSAPRPEIANTSVLTTCVAYSFLLFLEHRLPMSPRTAKKAPKTVWWNFQKPFKKGCTASPHLDYNSETFPKSGLWNYPEAVWRIKQNIITWSQYPNAILITIGTG